MLREIIILTPMNVSAFWALVFFSYRFKENRARYWLGLFMLVTAVLYTCHAVFFHGNRALYLKIDSLYLLAGLSVYPMYYIYIRLLTCDVRLKRSYILHFIPAIVFFSALLIMGQLLTSHEEQRYYDSVLIRNEFPGGGASVNLTVMAAVFFMSRLVFGLQTLIYLFLGYRLVQKYNERIANFYSNLEGRELIWVKLLIVSFLITAVISFIVNLFGRGVFLNNDVYLSVPAVLFSFLLFVIGIQGNKQDFNITNFDADEKQEINVERKVIVSRNEKLRQSLLDLLENEKIYLAPELKITELCRELNTNRTYLSNVINNDFNLSFNDLINKYRIEHAIILINKDENSRSSFQELSEASGFGSMSSFNRAFKKFTGTTVGGYINSHYSRSGAQISAESRELNEAPTERNH